MLLSIIIVGYNNKSLVNKCLLSINGSLKKTGYFHETEIIVVDNNSSDKLPKMIRKKFPKVILIENRENSGYAKANNQALKKARGNYILLLNSDTEVIGDSITMLINTMDKNSRIGLAGCKILNKDNSVQQSFGYFPNILRVFAWMLFIDDIPYIRNFIKPYHVTDVKLYGKARQVDWVTGAFILTKKEVVNRVGGMDENIFMYGEEVEWCYRIKKAGFQILYTPYGEIYHLKGGSGEGRYSGITEEFKSILYIYKKHFGLAHIYLIRPALLLGALLRYFIFAIIIRDPRKASLYAQAFNVAR